MKAGQHFFAFKKEIGIIGECSAIPADPFSAFGNTAVN